MKIADQLVPVALVEAKTQVGRDMRHLCKHSECSYIQKILVMEISEVFS